MNLSTWVKRHVFRMDVPEPKKTLAEETVLLNGAIQDLTKTMKELDKKVFDDALAAMNKAYRK